VVLKLLDMAGGVAMQLPQARRAALDRCVRHLERAADEGIRDDADRARMHEAVRVALAQIEAGAPGR
jgi:hypothetical protein